MVQYYIFSPVHVSKKRFSKYSCLLVILDLQSCLHVVLQQMQLPALHVQLQQMQLPQSNMEEGCSSVLTQYDDSSLSSSSESA